MPRDEEEIEKIGQGGGVSGQRVTQDHAVKTHFEIDSEEPAEGHSEHQSVQNGDDQAEQGIADPLDGLVFRVTFSWLFGVYLNMGLYGMILGYALATYSTALPNLFYFLFIPWYKRKTVI